MREQTEYKISVLPDAVHFGRRTRIELPAKLFYLDKNTSLYILNTLLDKLKWHNLISGEVIVLHDSIGETRIGLTVVIKHFLSANLIKTYPDTFDIKEITFEEAINSMKYGLSTKPDYTRIDTEFSIHDQNQLVYSFLHLFDNPRFYTINAKIFRTDLDLNDFWESGGAILTDKNSIGLFWTNDLYNKFR